MQPFHRIPTKSTVFTSDDLDSLTSKQVGNLVDTATPDNPLYLSVCRDQVLLCLWSDNRALRGYAMAKPVTEGEQG